MHYIYHLRVFGDFGVLLGVIVVVDLIGHVEVLVADAQIREEVVFPDHP